MYCNAMCDHSLKINTRHFNGCNGRPCTVHEYCPCTLCTLDDVIQSNVSVVLIHQLKAWPLLRVTACVILEAVNHHKPSTASGYAIAGCRHCK